MIENNNDWNMINRAGDRDDSDEIKQVLMDRFVNVGDNRKRELKRLTLEFNTFINLVNRDVRENFYEASNNVTKSTRETNPAGT